MPWKKCYHRLLKDDDESKRVMLEEMKLADMMQLDHYLPSLVRLVLRHQFCDIYVTIICVCDVIRAVNIYFVPVFDFDIHMCCSIKHINTLKICRLLLQGNT